MVWSNSNFLQNLLALWRDSRPLSAIARWGNRGDKDPWWQDTSAFAATTLVQPDGKKLIKNWSEILLQRHIVNGNGLGPSSWDASDIGYKTKQMPGTEGGRGGRVEEIEFYARWHVYDEEFLTPSTPLLPLFVWTVRKWNPRAADRSLKEWDKWLFAGFETKA